MNDTEIRKALNDIAELKKNVKGSLKIMRPILLDKSFISFSYLCSFFSAIYFLALHFMYKVYGNFASVPIMLKYIFFGSIIVLLIPLTLIKTRIIKQNLARQKRSVSLFNLMTMREFRNLYLVILYGFFLFTAFVVQICMQTGNWWLFLPASALGFAFMMALFGLTFQLTEYYILSAMFAIFGFIALFFMKDNYLLWLGAFGCVYPLSFGIVLQFTKGSHE